MPPVPINLWSQAHSVGLIAPSFSARVSRSDINVAGPEVPVVVDCIRLAGSAVAAHILAVAAGIERAAVVVAAGPALLAQTTSTIQCRGYLR